MPSTTFNPGTVIPSAWLNDVNTGIFTTLPGKADSAALAATGGSALIGYDGGTAQTVLDNAKALANYTALRAYTGRATGVRITQTGLAGIFQRDDADTTTPDNGGTVIVDASNRRWKRLYLGAVNVKWFGALGDGSTDDYAAIAAATAASQFVDFPPGQYKVSASIRWTNQWLVGAVDNGQLSLSNNQTMILPSGDFPAFVYYHPSNYNSQGGGIKNFNVYYSGTAPSTPDNRCGIRVPAAGTSGYPAFHTFENITVQGATWAIYDSSGSWMARWAHINSQNNYAGFYKSGGTTHFLESCYHRGGYAGFYFANLLGSAVKASAVDLCSSAVGGYFPIYVSNSVVSFDGCDFEANILTGSYASNYVFTGSQTLVQFDSCKFLSPDVRATTTEQYLIKTDSSAKVMFTCCDFSTPTFTGSGGLFSYSAALNSSNLKFDRCVMPAVSGGSPAATYSGLGTTGSVDYDNVTSAYQWAGFSRKVDRSLRASAVATIGAVNNGAAGSVNITVSGAQLGDYAEAAFSIALPAGVIVTAKVSATDTVTVSVGNLTGSTQTISSATIAVKVVPQ